ncbi:MAG: DegT/DnrJ/EryC1/StrS aminotransferase, partial [Thermoprotei archaeon]
MVKTDLPAIEGGRPVRDSSLSAWPKFTQREKELILQVLESGRLVSTLGRMTREFEEKFARF